MPNGSVKKFDGFSLLEMTIVLCAVGLLMAGVISPLSAQLTQQQYRQTRAQLAEVEQSLMGYVLSHQALNGKPYLPCPDTDGDGVENRLAGQCVRQYGQLPSQDLGVMATDVWGRAITYHISANFSNSETGFTLSSTANIEVWNTAGERLVREVPVIILSLGKHGATSASHVQAQENTDNDLQYVTGAFTPTFDDVLVWVSPNILFNRLVTAGRLP